MTYKQHGFATSGKLRNTARNPAIAAQVEENRVRFARGEDTISLNEAWASAKSQRKSNRQQELQEVLEETEKTRVAAV